MFPVKIIQRKQSEICIELICKLSNLAYTIVFPSNATEISMRTCIHLIGISDKFLLSFSFFIFFYFFLFFQFVFLSNPNVLYLHIIFFLLCIYVLLNCWILLHDCMCPHQLLGCWTRCKSLYTYIFTDLLLYSSSSPCQLII